MATRAEKLQQEYLEKHGRSLLPKKTIVKQNQGEQDHFHIYRRKNRLYPVPFVVTLPWKEIEQLKNSKNTYSTAI